MAPDGQVRLQASVIRLDHSLLSPVSEGEAIMPLRSPELFEPIFCRWSNAATVVQWVIIQFAERIARAGFGACIPDGPA